MYFLKLIFLGIAFSTLIVKCFTAAAPIDRKLEKFLNSFKLPKQDKNCGVSNTEPNINDLRIIDGVNAISNSWPWIVSLQYYDKDLKEFRHGCGGSIIYSKYILTAAHCVTDVTNFTLKTTLIVAGVTNLKKATNSNKYQVEKIYFNSNFNASDELSPNDIAIFKLKRPIKFTSNIRPICLPNSVNDYKKVIGKTLVLVGW